LQNEKIIKKGINQWSFPDNLSAGHLFKKVREYNFQGIELTLSTTGLVTRDITTKEIARLRTIADGEGVAINSVATGLFWQFSLTSHREDIRQKAFDLVSRQLEIAAELGAGCILVCPGTVGVDFTPDEVVPDAGEIAFFAGSEVIPYEVAYERSLEGLKKLSAIAESHKVSIGVENIWNKFLLSPLEFRSFIDEINSPWVGVYLDVGNMVAFGYPEQWIRILGKRIKRIHLKDYRRDAGSLAGFVPLLAGDVNWPEVAKALREVKYESWVNAEMVPQFTHHPYELIKSTSSAIDSIFGLQ
jgi:hexulose-6-phosphate isomerase